MKFGGSSLANAAQVQKALGIVRERLSRAPVIVCSAHKGITDMLIAAGKNALDGNADASAIIERQREIADELGCPDDLLDDHYSQLEELLRGISLVGEASPRSLDALQSFGERMSVRTVADFLTRNAVPARAFDAWDLGFITNTEFGTARPIEGFEAKMREAFEAQNLGDTVPVITGFVGKTPTGEITTVGRNGSDFTATCFAAGLGAEECEIWTDTDGVMTADPSVVGDARSIPCMSFAEASELAWYGGRVLHPSTLLPAVKRNIPVRVMNTNRPEHPGTVITEAGGENGQIVTSIAYKESQIVITIETTRMLGTPGFLAKVFSILGNAGVDIDMISTSEISVSMTAHGLENLNAAVKELETLGKVTIDTDKTIICVVGKNVKHQRGLAARVFGALRDADVNVEMVSQGSNKINLSLLIDDAEIDRAIPALHNALFE